MLYFDDLFKTTVYPSGELHVAATTLISEGPRRLHVIAPDVRDFNGLGCLVSANDILERKGCTVRWFVPFFPFARDDRRNSADHGLELSIAMQMVSHMDVTILDPHSDVAGMLPHIPQDVVVSHWRGLWPSNLCFIIPDAGAVKKAFKFTGGDPYVECTKKRDVGTGELSGFVVQGEADFIEGRHCVIVDDICDGGGTFLGLAKLIREHNPTSLSLAVSHGLFTKGTNIIFEIFTDIYSTGEHEDARIHTIPYHQLWKDGDRI